MQAMDDNLYYSTTNRKICASMIFFFCDQVDLEELFSLSVSYSDEFILKNDYKLQQYFYQFVLKKTICIAQ